MDSPGHNFPVISQSIKYYEKKAAALEDWGMLD